MVSPSNILDYIIKPEYSLKVLISSFIVQALLTSQRFMNIRFIYSISGFQFKLFLYVNFAYPNCQALLQAKLNWADSAPIYSSH